MNLRSLLTLVLALSIFCYTCAQEQQTQGEYRISPKFGIKGGINLSNLYVEDVEDENLKLGVHGGFFAKIPVTRGLSIQPELIYSSKGSKLKYNNILSTGEYRFNLNYVELPVLAVINLAKNFNLHGGGYFGYMASANVKDIDDEGNTNSITELNAEDFNRFDYGFVGGLGVDAQNFTIGVRYNYGLNKIGDESTLGGQLLGNGKNSVLALYIGFGF